MLQIYIHYLVIANNIWLMLVQTCILFGLTKKSALACFSLCQDRLIFSSTAVRVVY